MKSILGFLLMMSVTVGHAQSNQQSNLSPQQSEKIERTVEIDSIVECDTQEQAERLAAVFKDNNNLETAMNKVNAEVQDSKACMAVALAYVRGPMISSYKTAMSSIDVTAIIVIGILTEHGLKPVKPAPAFAVFTTNERGA